MERAFIIDKFNTYNDWRLILTKKSVTPPQPKTKYVSLDGMNGTLDLSEVLTGEITYNDRTVSATFLLTEGTYKERNLKLQEIANKLHGRKVKLIEPDDLDHYLLGRITIKDIRNILPYSEITIEAVCEPWRYSLEDIIRKVDVNGQEVDIVLTNNGAKNTSPEITIIGSIDIIFNDVQVSLTSGTYKVSDFKLCHGVNLVKVIGTGSATFKYKEVNI